MTIDLNTRNVIEKMIGANISSWSALEEITTEKKIAKNEHFFQNFDHCDEVAIIKQGLFRIYLIDDDGEEKTFSFVAEHGFILDFFLSWKETSNIQVSAQALEDSEIYVIKYEQFLSLVRNNQEWAHLYAEILERAYVQKTKRITEFVLYNAKTRLQKFMNNKYLDVDRVPKTHLASYLGIAPPSLSRLLREL
jgi:CRP-like cAMP-binding protein